MRTVGKLEMALASILQVEPCRRNHFGCWTANLVGWSPENMRHALCDCHWLLEVLQTHNMQRCFSWFDITNTCLKNTWFNGLIDICMWGGCLTIWNQKHAYPPWNLPALISYCVLHIFNLTVTVLQTAVTPFYSMGHGMLVEARLGVRPSSLAWVAQWVGQWKMTKKRNMFHMLNWHVMLHMHRQV